MHDNRSLPTAAAVHRAPGFATARIRHAFALLATLAAIAAAPARAHDAPKGWSYPFACCSDYDCRAVPTKQVSERPEGYVINVTGEVVAHGDSRLKHSPDGDFHWCSVAGKNDGRTICLFVPPRAF